MENSEVQKVKWHVGKWGGWGWTETLFKLAAIAAGLVAGWQGLFLGGMSLGLNLRLAAVVVLLLTSFMAVIQLVRRVRQKETISFVFAVLNLLGHLALVFALLHAPFGDLLALFFGVFYLLGQVVKIQFLRVTGYTEYGMDTAGLVQFTAVQAAFYLVFALLVLF